MGDQFGTGLAAWRRQQAGIVALTLAHPVDRHLGSTSKTARATPSPAP